MLTSFVQQLTEHEPVVMSTTLGNVLLEDEPSSVMWVSDGAYTMHYIHLV